MTHEKHSLRVICEVWQFSSILKKFVRPGNVTYTNNAFMTKNSNTVEVYQFNNTHGKKSIIHVNNYALLQVTTMMMIACLLCTIYFLYMSILWPGQRGPGYLSIVGGRCHKYHFCRDKHSFVATNIVLSRQAYFCRGKHVFVATKHVSREREREREREVGRGGEESRRGKGGETNGMLVFACWITHSCCCFWFAVVVTSCLYRVVSLL